ncbi:hypothetical protein AKO1_005989 [Acrasis kona]|uniref:RNase III domain-containing protein n=1 Tax=Acrasis kona TaxID=1008807 RepID=A0AAW2YJF7_9EUKA
MVCNLFSQLTNMFTLKSYLKPRLIFTIGCTQARYAVVTQTEKLTKEVPSAPVQTEKQNWRDLRSTVQKLNYERNKHQQSRTGREYRSKDLTQGVRSMLTNPRFNLDEFFNTDQDMIALTEATTHQSFGAGKVSDQSRLSFLGREAAEFLVTDILVNKYYPKEEKNNSTRMSENVINAMKSLYLSRSHVGVLVAGGQWGWGFPGTDYDELRFFIRCTSFHTFATRTRMDAMADSVYAIIGAVYQNYGPKQCKRFIEKFIMNKSPNEIMEALMKVKPTPQVLNDIMFTMDGVTPRRIETKEGNIFKCAYYVRKNLLGFATASNPEDAKNMGAFNGLVNLGRLLPTY